MTRPDRAEVLGNRLLTAGPMATGVLLVFAFPRWDQAWLGWVALVPLLLSLRRTSGPRALLAGWAGGILCSLGVFPWITEVRSATLLAIGLGHLFLGLYFGLFCGIGSLLVRRLGLPLVALAPLWVAVEYLRAHFFFLAFPWPLLGHSQHGNLALAQTASITGVYGVSFILVLGNGAIADFIACWRRKNAGTDVPAGRWKPVPALLIAAAVLAVVHLLGWRSLSREGDGKALSVAVVQGNVAQAIKWDPAYREGIISKYEGLSEEAARTGPQLIVWPETATPGFVLKDMALLKRLAGMIRRLGTYFLIGSAEYPKFSREPPERGQGGNTALFFSAEGKVLGQYLKTRLLPLGEYVPYKGLIPWPGFIVPEEKKNWLIPGKELTLFEIKEARFGVLICWENLFPDLSRRYVLKGADFLVNLSNEAWFGKTAAPYQILAMCVFRAIENRVPMVRATNTGISCFIDSRGRITGRVQKDGEPLFVEGVSRQELRLSRAGTFYTRFGDLFAFACIVLSAALVLCFVLKGTRQPSAGGRSEAPSPAGDGISRGRIPLSVRRWSWP